MGAPKGIVGCQFAPHPRKVQNLCNPPDLMILRNGLLKIEAIEQLPLVSVLPTHHRPISQKSRHLDRITIRHCPPNDFCNKIGPIPKWRKALGISAF